MVDASRQPDPADRPTVAVVIVNFNAGAMLCDCLRSVHSQSSPPDRIIVADNGSTDGSLAAARAAFPTVEYIEPGSNLGFAAANNRAIIAASDCRYVALLNPDAIAHPDWLEELLRAAEENPQHGMFSSLLLLAHTDRIDGAGDCYHPSGLAWRRHHQLPVAQATLEQEEVFAPCAAAALYRRDALLRVGLFDESYFCYFEDVDLAFRLQLHGVTCLFVPRAVVDHIGSAITGRRSDFSVYHGYRNLEWTWFKCMPWPWILWHLPAHLLVMLIALFHYSLRGQTRTIFRAKWHALLGLRRIRAARKRLRASATVAYRELRTRMSHAGLFAILRDRGAVK